jgi:hypothetical protein
LKSSLIIGFKGGLISESFSPWLFHKKCAKQKKFKKAYYSCAWRKEANFQNLKRHITTVRKGKILVSSSFENWLLSSMHSCNTPFQILFRLKPLKYFCAQKQA